MAVAGFELLLSNVVSLKFGPVDFKAIIISAPASTSAALLSQSSLGKIDDDLSPRPGPKARLKSIGLNPTSKPLCDRQLSADLRLGQFGLLGTTFKGVLVGYHLKQIMIES